jgi:hypothetical protein
MANSNNAVKFVKKNALDPINFQRLLNNDRVIEVNSGKDVPMGNVVWDGNFNPLPADVYKMLEDTMKEEENITGITRYAVGSDSRSLNTTATGISMISSMSQRRLNYIVRHIASALRGVFTKWAKFNSELIDMVTIPTLEGFMEMSGMELPSDQIGVTVMTPTAGLLEKKQADITRMIQAIAPMSGILGPEMVIGLLAELADTMKMPTVELMLKKAAEEAEQMKGQPSPETQLDYQKAKTEAAEAYAKIQKDIASADKNSADAEKQRLETLLLAGAVI